MITSVETTLAEFDVTLGSSPANGLEFLVDWFNQFADIIGLPCVCVEKDTNHIIASSHGEPIPFATGDLGIRASGVHDFEIHLTDNSLLRFLAVVPVDHNYVVRGFARSPQPANPRKLVEASSSSEWNDHRFEEWVRSIPVCDQQVLERLLQCSLQSAAQHRREVSLRLEAQSLRQQVEETLERIDLLHGLTQNLHQSHPTVEWVQQCLEGLQTALVCSGSVVLFQNTDQPERFLMNGQLPFDQSGLGRLLKRFQQHDWSKPLVRNQLENTLLGSVFPGLKNLLIASIGDENSRHGWIAACNLNGGREFGPGESKLIATIASIMEMHTRTGQMFDQQDDLQLSFVRSLVSTLDAKDAHTRGHSERVALIARRLAEQLQLPENELDDIYLSSLLHDLGKIGVDDRILSKAGNLTVEEFAQIQQHPMIGFEILSPLKNLTRILPGVRNHHEAFNGRGYPDKLRGEEIPLMARVISVADSYDAMASDRPYREGMPLPQLEDIFRRGAGEQWDPLVIDAYFEVSAEIRSLFESYSPTVGNLLDTLNLNLSGVYHVRKAAKPEF